MKYSTFNVTMSGSESVNSWPSSIAASILAFKMSEGLRTGSWRKPSPPLTTSSQNSSSETLEEPSPSPTSSLCHAEVFWAASQYSPVVPFRCLWQLSIVRTHPPSQSEIEVILQGGLYVERTKQKFSIDMILTTQFVHELIIL